MKIICGCSCVREEPYSQSPSAKSHMGTGSKKRRADTVADGATNTESVSWLPGNLKGPGWCARGDRRPTDKRVPFNRPTAKQIYDALPFVRRYFMYWMKFSFDREKLFINTFQPLRHKPFYGVPCGGVGCGAMGRDFRGGFCKFSLRPGLVEHQVDVIPANQFILSVRKDDEVVYQKVLSAADITRKNGQLSAWDFSFPSTDLYYRGLYPRSWTVYKISELGIKVVIRQLSPVIPDDYEDSTLPVCCFVVEVINDSDVDYTCSLAFSFRNGTGSPRWEKETECTSAKFNDGDITGVTLSHSISQMPCTYGIATTSAKNACISVCKGFDPSKNGATYWNTLKETGDLVENDDCSTSGSRELAVAVCQRIKVAAGENRTVDFSLAWDMPKVTFGSEERAYLRRYTRFVGADGAASDLCTRALRRRVDWERKIDEWQNPVLDHPHLPVWYKSAVFNELYFMTDGGSLWFEFDDNWSELETQLSPYTKNLMRKHGRFGYLESWEYRMVNTYDVHFYASFALARLWPKLELTMQAEFTDQIAHSVDKQTKFHMEGDIANRKTVGRVPHDLGNPADDPWLYTNAYVMHDTGKWKDLNLKYVLTSWRDHIALAGDDDDVFLKHTWPAVQLLIDAALENWDQDKDGMIENFGKADQTYDAWQMEGVSSYCGSLWLAALKVAIEMARIVGNEEKASQYTETLDKAKEVFVNKLWTGEYFRFCERSKSRESIMADQLCGIWFLQSVSPELAAELLPAEKIRSALDKIYEMNVQGFAGGKLGAVNGMRPDGSVDRYYIQADEVWTGVTYALAAFLLQQGETDRAFHTASGCYSACFEKTGLQYQTPEALYETKYYRAIGYMRPLSIWAMQWALERHCSLNTPEDRIKDSVLQIDQSSQETEEDLEIASLDSPSIENLSLAIESLST